MQQEDCHQSGYRPGEEERLSIFANPVLTIADQRLHPRASPTVAIGTSLDLSLQPVQLHVTLYQLAVAKYSRCSISESITFYNSITITLPLPRSKLAVLRTHRFQCSAPAWGNLRGVEDHILLCDERSLSQGFERRCCWLDQVGRRPWES